jgi:hypothetical protein
MIKKKYQEEIKSGQLPKNPILYVMIVRNNFDTKTKTDEDFTVLIQTEKTANYYKNITEKLFPMIKEATPGKITYV